MGVDHNPESVAVARAAGLAAWLPGDLPESSAGFDTLLFSHVLEHVADPEAMISTYRRLLRAGGRLVLITPQEAGWRSDPTHLRFVDGAALQRLLGDLGFGVERAYSFPMPRWAGRTFRHNEFVVVGRDATTVRRRA